MQLNKFNVIEQIKTRICELQNAYVSLQEQSKKSQNNFDRNLEDSALRIIDILDMIEMAKLNMDLEGTINSNAQRIINKIEKRLFGILQSWQVQEIVFEEGKIEVGKSRVVETQKVSGEIPTGTIIEICRKGYQRRDKIIRPTDVITAA